MSKIKKELLSNACYNLTKDSSSKFWGLICVLSAIETTDNIKAGVTYKIDTIKLSQTLERLFYFGDSTKSFSDSSNYVTFSTSWQKKASEIFTKNVVSIRDAALFFNIDNEIAMGSDVNAIVEGFIKEIKLSAEDVEQIFDTEFANESNIVDEYSYSKHSLWGDIKSRLNIESENTTLTMEAPYTVVSHPAELSRAPFIQSLYAAQSNFECLLLTKFNLKELYTSGKGIEDADEVSIKALNISRNYNIDELASKLASMYNGAGDKKKVASIYIFGIKYGRIITRNDYRVRELIELSGLNSSYESELSKALRIYNSIYNNEYGLMFDSSSTIKELKSDSFAQKIFYGAPGTGKSHKIKSMTQGQNVTKVTFHPDTDYSSFVGCYKPKVIDGGTEITYGFVPQAFAKAYVAAWKNLEQPYCLVIEEINRGNCAQIFGDIFQLLDRYDDGFSKYVIDVDSDLAAYLKSELDGIAGYHEKISELAELEVHGDDYSKIALPSNLSILATMNTSDQSLFPMDSAFKRRWDWEYLPIDSSKVEDVIIDVDGSHYSWSKFLDTVNQHIYEVNTSEDKQLGPFFVKANEGTNIITFEQFRSKVMFYLWFEIYKDEDSKSIFKVNAGTKDSEVLESFTFGDLFKDNGAELLNKFMVDSMKLEVENKPADDPAVAEVANVE